MNRLERFDREVAAFMIRRARRANPKAKPWLVCLSAARSPERVGDFGVLAQIRSVAVKFPIVVDLEAAIDDTIARYPVALGYLGR